MTSFHLISWLLCSHHFRLFSVYIQMSENVQKYIRLHMVNMIRSIGMRSQDLIQLVREFPPGGETLAIRIVAILCESSKQNM